MYRNDKINQNWEHFKRFYNHETILCLPKRHYGWKYKLPELLVHNYLKLNMDFIEEIKLACFDVIRENATGDVVDLYFDKQIAYFTISINDNNMSHKQLRNILFTILQKYKINIYFRQEHCGGYRDSSIFQTTIYLTRCSKVPQLYKKIFQFHISKKNIFILFILLHYLPPDLCQYFLQNFKYDLFHQFLNRYHIYRDQ